MTRRAGTPADFLTNRQIELQYGGLIEVQDDFPIGKRSVYGS